ncbi:MAG: 50S ribosomal protein L29 [Bacteroidales bacterium]|jgi:large subunit ribosomal protein L29
MKIAEIRELSTSEIQERIDTEKSLLIKLKMNHAVSPLDNPLKITVARKNIARLKTELRQRLLTEKQKS